MHRTARRLLVTGIAAGALVSMTPTAAHATIHEIVAQYCSGKGPLEPPGVDANPTKRSFARPVLANGVVSVVVTTTNGVTNTAFLIDESHPANKVVVLRYVTVPTGPGATLTFPMTAADPEFPAFGSCPRFSG
jgi:hypothetical protein